MPVDPRLRAARQVELFLGIDPNEPRDDRKRLEDFYRYSRKSRKNFEPLYEDRSSVIEIDHKNEEVRYIKEGT